MIIDRLTRYDGRPRPPCDTRQLNVRIFWPGSVDRAWPRLAIGAVFRSFSGYNRLWVFLKSFASCDGCEAVGIVWQGCDKSMRSTWSNSWTRIPFFLSWYSCSYYVPAYLLREFFFCYSNAKCLLQLTCIKDSRSLAKYPCKTFFHFFHNFLALYFNVAYCFSYPTGQSRFQSLQTKGQRQWITLLFGNSSKEKTPAQRYLSPQRIPLFIILLKNPMGKLGYCLKYQAGIMLRKEALNQWKKVYASLGLLTDHTTKNKDNETIIR